MKRVHCLVTLALAGLPAPAFAGPPYLTDDPIPTETGHWEIYAFNSVEGRSSTVAGESGVDLNYGPVKDIQLTATLPFSFSHVSREGWQTGTGAVELGVKYRFIERSGFSAAFFPRVILPTASHSPGERTQFLLPFWLGQDFGHGTSLFGGGGYTINPGLGNRDFWQSAVAVTHDLTKSVSVGAEIARQGPDTVGAAAQTRAGLGSIIHIAGPASLLISGGPTWSEQRSGYHLYAALGLNL